MWDVWWTNWLWHRFRFFPSTSIFPSQHRCTNAPHNTSSSKVPLTIDKRAKPGHLPTKTFFRKEEASGGKNNSLLLPFFGWGNGSVGRGALKCNRTHTTSLFHQQRESTQPELDTHTLTSQAPVQILDRAYGMTAYRDTKTLWITNDIAPASIL